MKKGYQAWTRLKGLIHNDTSSRLFFHEREIWLSHLGENIGYEEDGKGRRFLRPVIVLRKFNNEVFWGIPLTHTDKNLSFYFSFVPHLESQESQEKSTAILSQIRLIDAKRLSRLLGYISESDFAVLKEKLKALLP